MIFASVNRNGSYRSKDLITYCRALPRCAYCLFTGTCSGELAYLRRGPADWLNRGRATHVRTASRIVEAGDGGPVRTEVTKEAAEMVLTEDNFASISHAVEEGRTVYDNLRKAILFLWLSSQGVSEDVARTVAVNTMVMFEVFYLLNSRFITAPVLNRNGLLGSRPVLLAIALVIVFQLLFTYTPLMQGLFGTTAIGWRHWLWILMVSVNVLWIVELEKWAARRAGWG